MSRYQDVYRPVSKFVLKLGIKLSKAQQYLFRSLDPDTASDDSVSEFLDFYSVDVLRPLLSGRKLLGEFETEEVTRLRSEPGTPGERSYIRDANALCALCTEFAVAANVLNRISLDERAHPDSREKAKWTTLVQLERLNAALSNLMVSDSNIKHESA